MRVKRSDEQRLTIVAFPWVLGAILFPTSVLALRHLIGSLNHNGVVSDETIGSFLAFLLSFICACVFTKRSVFDFDRVHRQLAWHRRGFFGRTGGVLSFDEIKSAFVESISSHSSGPPSYRVVLETTSGMLPITESTRAGDKERCEVIRSHILRALE